MSNNIIDNTVFKWTIRNLEIIPNDNGMINVVKSIHYTYTGTYESYSAEIEGVTYLESPESSNYKPYEELTHDEVVSWIQTKYDIGLFNKNIIEQLQQKIVPPPTSIIGILPWSVDISNNTITDISGTDISGTDISGTDISGTDISGTDISGTDISGTDISGTDISGTDISGTDISGTDISGTDISVIDM
jgi:hypothetical protein